MIILRMFCTVILLMMSAMKYNEHREFSEYGWYDGKYLLQSQKLLLLSIFWIRWAIALLWYCLYNDE